MDQSDIIKSLLDANTELTKQVVELSRALADARAPQPIQNLEMQTRGALWMPETEEDALAAFRAGEITKDDLESVLKELDFFNAEITVPSGN